MNRKSPALEGWFTLDADKPQLIGSQCISCGSYYFPKSVLFCKNPDCNGDEFEVVKLSRRGRIWSYTNTCYMPPEPFVAPDPFVPFSLAAVSLDKEKMIVLGQVVSGVDVSELEVGMEVELVLEALCVSDGVEKVIWKWKPISSSGQDQSDE